MPQIDRQLFFDAVREAPFPGKLNQSQVDGMDSILAAYEDTYAWQDLRWLAYALATTYHETSATMQPIEEYQGAEASYGQPDPVTGECYFGRGFVQLTHKSNYERADKELGFTGNESCVLHPERQLEAEVAAPTMFQGMEQGWFRTAKDGSKETLAKYFSDTRDDAFGAREIINGDKTKVPSWSNGVSIGSLIVGYHNDFLDALQNAYIETPIEDELAPISPAGLRDLAARLLKLANLMEEAQGKA